MGIISDYWNNHVGYWSGKTPAEKWDEITDPIVDEFSGKQKKHHDNTKANKHNHQKGQNHKAPPTNNTGELWSSGRDGSSGAVLDFGNPFNQGYYFDFGVAFSDLSIILVLVGAFMLVI